MSYTTANQFLHQESFRSSLTDDEYQSDRAKARDGMSEGRKLGFLMPLQVKAWRDVDVDLWTAFAKLGTPYVNLLNPTNAIRLLLQQPPA